MPEQQTAGTIDNLPPLGQEEPRKEEERTPRVFHPYFWVVAWVLLLVVVGGGFWYFMYRKIDIPRTGMDEIVEFNQPERTRHADVAENEARQRFVESNTVADEVVTQSSSEGSVRDDAMDASSATPTLSAEELAARRRALEENTAVPQ